MPLELVVSPQPSEPEEHVGQHRVPGRHRVVVEVLRPRDQRLAPVGREEEAAVLLVGEELDRAKRQPPRLEQPARLARGEMELEQPVRDVGVVVEIAGAARPPVPPRARAAGPVREWTEHELRGVFGGLDPVGPSQEPSRLGERRDREPVPGGDRLVVEAGLRPVRPLGEQPGAQLRLELPTDDRAAVLERLEQLGRHALLHRPRVRQPSTPSVSASCALAKPPSGSRSSRSR